MRKNALLVLLVVVLLLLAAAPVVAGQGAVKDIHYAVECFADPPVFTAPPKIVGDTIHVRGALGHAEEFLWNGEAWVAGGENDTVINFNGKLGPMGPEDLRLWGTFDLDLGELGTFTGSWASGNAVGKSADGLHIKADLNPPEFEALQYFPGCPDGLAAFPAIYRITDPPN